MRIFPTQVGHPKRRALGKYPSPALPTINHMGVGSTILESFGHPLWIVSLRRKSSLEQCVTGNCPLCRRRRTFALLPSLERRTARPPPVPLSFSPSRGLRPRGLAALRPQPQSSFSAGVVVGGGGKVLLGVSCLVPPACWDE